MWFTARETPLPGMTVVQGKAVADHRGEFSRLFCAAEFAELAGVGRIVQVNLSNTTRTGTVRGLHFQRPPHGELKIVRCLRGRVWDVAVDLRRDSRTFLRWHAEELSAGEHRMVIIPVGFAHGFQALEADSQLIYFHTEQYRQEAEGGLRHDDPALGIEWPLAVTGLSDRDAAFPLVDAGFAGL